MVYLGLMDDRYMVHVSVNLNTGPSCFHHHPFLRNCLKQLKNTHVKTITQDKSFQISLSIGEIVDGDDCPLIIVRNNKISNLFKSVVYEFIAPHPHLSQWPSQHTPTWHAVSCQETFSFLCLALVSYLLLLLLLQLSYYGNPGRSKNMWGCA